MNEIYIYFIIMVHMILKDNKKKNHKIKACQSQKI